MKIGFSGAQSTGKTTLLNALKLEEVFEDFIFCDEVTRRVKSYGLPINENGTDITQRLIMQEHIVNVFLNDKMITDRTSLDGLVYTTYLHIHGKVSKDTLEYAQRVFRKVQPQYDLQFYIKPEFTLENDGTRSPDVSFRDQIVGIFDDVISSYNLNVVYLSGTVQQRINTIKENYV
jgi:GTPase SAR1 family protein